VIALLDDTTATTSAMDVRSAKASASPKPVIAARRANPLIGLATPAAFAALDIF